jgi:hypothetical protein
MADNTPHTPDFLEDATGRSVIDAGKVLTEDDLLNGGFAPVRAYVRTRAGKAATRQQRHREKLQDEGVKQVNVQAPAEAHPVIRALAERLRQGEDLQAVLRDLAKTGAPAAPDAKPQPQPQPQPRPRPAASDPVAEVIQRGGWRAWLLRWLLGR